MHNKIWTLVLVGALKCFPSWPQSEQRLPLLEFFSLPNDVYPILSVFQAYLISHSIQEAFFSFQTSPAFTDFFFNFIFKLYIIALVLPNIKMNPPQVYMYSAFHLVKHASPWLPVSMHFEGTRVKATSLIFCLSDTWHANFQITNHNLLTWSHGGTHLPSNHLGSAAAAAAKSFQSCPTLCDPTDGSPPGSPVPGILQPRTLERVAISFSNAWEWKVSEVAQSCLTLSDPMGCSLPGSSVHGIFQARVLEWGASAFSKVSI